MSNMPNRVAATGFPVARVSNAASPSSAPSKTHEWRNLPQPVRDPETSGVTEKTRESDRNLPTAPPQPPPREEA
jgi:hypothetical protein